MDIIQVIVLSLVQGLSEFLPISSSAHLVLIPKLVGWKDQGLAFDVAVHIGTLSAILFYFKDRLGSLLKDFLMSIKYQKKIGQSTLVWSVGLATIPVGIVGLLCHDYIKIYARSELLIAITAILFGVVLYMADRKNGKKTEQDINIKFALLIGLAQAIALIPGVSRSGVTISAALLLGFDKTTSANFSFLLSIPVIMLAGGLETIKLINSPEHIDYTFLIIGIFISGASAYLCVKLFMQMILKFNMLAFVIYRILLGSIILLSI